MIEDAIGDSPRCIVHARRDVQLADSVGGRLNSL
jgi:hypothetical protein